MSTDFPCNWKPFSPLLSVFQIFHNTGFAYSTSIEIRNPWRPCARLSSFLDIARQGPYHSQKNAKESNPMKIFDGLHFFPWNNASANNCNTCLIEGSKRILVDPGHYHLFNHIKDGLEHLSLTLRDIDVVIITHGHPDHIEGIRLFAEPPALIAISSLEWHFIKRVAPNYGDALGIPQFEPNILLQEGTFAIGSVSLQVIHTPGHSPGSICLYWPEKKTLITGDVIFKEGLGRTDLPGGDGRALKESILKLSKLDVEVLLPGHMDPVLGKEAVKDNFEAVQNYWFDYI